MVAIKTSTSMSSIKVNPRTVAMHGDPKGFRMARTSDSLLWI